MGALRRATLDEIAGLAADPAWWPDVLARVRDEGSIRETRNENVWSYGAFIGWIRSDERRSAEYDEALRDYAHKCVLDAIPIADEVEETKAAISKAKLRIDTRHWSAGKWDRARYGEKVDHIGVLLDPLSELLREISERRMAALRGPVEKVITSEAVFEPVDEI